MTGDVHLTVGLVAQALGIAAIVSSPLLVCMLASFRLHRIRQEHAARMGRPIRSVRTRPETWDRALLLATRARRTWHQKRAGRRA
jgi:hypothetical protein